MKFKRSFKFILLLLLAIGVVFSGTSSRATEVTPDTEPEEKPAGL